MNVSKPETPWLEAYGHPNDWHADYAPLSLPDLLVEAAAKHPQAPLVDFMGRKYSYAELLAQAKHFAAGLQAWGIKRGDRVGLYLPNVPTYIPAYYGALMAGATLVNFSPLYTAHELEAQVADSGTRLLVTVSLAKLLPTALTVLRGSALEHLVVADFPSLLPPLKSFAFRLLGRKDLTPIPQQADITRWDAFLGQGDSAPVAIDPLKDIALLQYTGGTTGTPKGAMLTHQNLSANARQIAAIDPQAGKRDVILGALPLFHVFANSGVLNRTVVNGGCIAMLPRFETGQVLAAIRRVKPTSFPGVPTMFQALLDDPGIDKADLSSLRVCIVGGAPLPLLVKERWKAKTGVSLVEGYGLPESSGVATANPYEGDDSAGTIGQPLPGTYVRLLDREDPTRDAPPGEPGELAIAGPQIMQGYWQRPEADESAFAQIGGTRWLRTGDVAVLEGQGYIRIVDRIKDMIAVGGFKVFPSQVEHVLLEHPAVKEALVIGMPDERLGEKPRAFVTLQEGEDTPGAVLREWLNLWVGKHERVDDVVVRQSMPKTMIGKLDRKTLKEQALAGFVD